MQKTTAVIFSILTLASAASAAAGKDSLVSLLCDTTRVSDGGKVQFSVVFNEPKKSLLINGSPTGATTFTPHHITAKERLDFRVENGISYEMTVSLDRVSGAFLYMMDPVNNDGGAFTEAQLATIASGPTVQSFMGTCVPTKAMF
jgi:hypothetical protein